MIRLNTFASGLTQPVAISSANDGTGRLFAVEQNGFIRVITDEGNLLPAPFLDIHSRVNCCGERGLLGLAFPESYAGNGHFYINYTDTNGDTVISRFSVSGENPNLADPDSEVVLLKVEQPYPNHNGGQLAFGPDGYLYIGMGDGGNSGDPQNRAQTPGELLGKLLRIDPESDGCVSDPPTAQKNYCIPPDNPYLNDSDFRPEIWAMGLRNPWRFSFDRLTGDLYIADVGQNLVEEIDFQPAGSNGGENYGWHILEGDRCYSPVSDCTVPENYQQPVTTYEHGENDSNGCSVTGGYVYRGSRYTTLQGIYYYADFCTGKVFGLKQESGAWMSQLLLTAPFMISTFGEDQDGNLYLANYNEGIIYQILPQPGAEDLPNRSYFPFVGG